MPQDLKRGRRVWNGLRASIAEKADDRAWAVGRERSVELLGYSRPGNFSRE
jgi:hypothetical protein